MSSFPIAGVLACLAICVGLPAGSQSLPSVTGVAMMAPAPATTIPVFPELREASLVPLFERPLPSQLPVAARLQVELERQNDLSAFGVRCGASISLTRRPEAQVGVALEAPCRRSQDVLVRHAGLEFGIRLSGIGQSYFEMPLLENNAKIETIFQNGETLNGSIAMPELRDHIRLAVMWEDTNLAELVPGKGHKSTGTLVTLGLTGTPKLQIYSHPRMADRGKAVARVDILNRITDEACAEPRSGRVLRLQPGQAPIRYRLHLSPPGCEADGDVPVLKNILADLKLTAK